MSANGAAHRQVVAVLDNLRSVLNVGSIFRSAEWCRHRASAFVWHHGNTRPPQICKDCIRRRNKCILVVPSQWCRSDRKRFKPTRIYNLGTGSHTIIAIAFTTLLPDTPLALVVGNERAGIDPDILALCHRVLHLPMCGVKESLNVAVAFGIAAYHLTYQMIDQNQTNPCRISGFSFAEARGNLRTRIRKGARPCRTYLAYRQHHESKSASDEKFNGLYSAIMTGKSPLSRSQREMLAVVVSVTNGCIY